MSDGAAQLSIDANALLTQETTESESLECLQKKHAQRRNELTRIQVSLDSAKKTLNSAVQAVASAPPEQRGHCRYQVERAEAEVRKLEGAERAIQNELKEREAEMQTKTQLLREIEQAKKQLRDQAEDAAAKLQHSAASAGRLNGRYASVGSMLTSTLSGISVQYLAVAASLGGNAAGSSAGGGGAARANSGSGNVRRANRVQSHSSAQHTSSRGSTSALIGNIQVTSLDAAALGTKATTATARLSKHLNDALADDGQTTDECEKRSGRRRIADLQIAHLKDLRAGLEDLKTVQAAYPGSVGSELKVDPRRAEGLRRWTAAMRAEIDELCGQLEKELKASGQFSEPFVAKIVRQTKLLEEAKLYVEKYGADHPYSKDLQKQLLNAVNPEALPLSLSRYDQHSKTWSSLHVDPEISLDLMCKAQKKLQKISEHSGFGMLVSHEYLEDCMRNKFKNLFETGSSGGFNNKSLRAKAEQNMLGLSESAPGNERPKYGMMLDQDTADAFQFTDEYRKYGDSLVYFKKSEVGSAVTYTISDSLGPAVNGCTIAGRMSRDPAKIDINGFIEDSPEVRKYCADGRSRKKYMEDFLAGNEDAGVFSFVKETNLDYIELQYHGDLTAEAVDKICLTVESLHDLHYTEVQRWIDLGIKVDLMSQGESGAWNVHPIDANWMQEHPWTKSE